MQIDGTMLVVPLIKPPPRKIACNMTGPAFTYPYLY